MKAKYIGDISKDSLQLIEIDSYHGKDFDQKLKLAEHQVSLNKNLRLFDEKKEMIGEYIVDEKTAAIFLQENQQRQIKVDEQQNERQVALDKREQELNERESDLIKREAALTKVKTPPVESGGNHKKSKK